MEKIINEETLVCISKENSHMKLVYLDFQENPLKKHRYFLEMINLNKKSNSWTLLRDKGYEYFSSIKEEFPTYFHKEEVLANPSIAFGREYTIGKDTLVKKMSSKIKDDDRKFYIFYKIKTTFIHLAN